MKRRPLHPCVFLLILAAIGLPKDTHAESWSDVQFLDILARWAAGGADKESAPHDLLDYVTSEARDRTDALRARKVRLLRRLFADNPDTAIPVIDLYRNAHMLAVVRRDKGAEAFLRLEILRLTNEYTFEDRGRDDPYLGSWILTSVAVPLREVDGLHLASALLDEAIDLDPRNIAALFAAASIREKYGDYRSAALLLRNLIEVSPLPEARLRLALCLVRTGKTEKAEELLEGLARGASPPWIRAIAYQEWAQSRLRMGAPDAALNLAREGYEAAPEDGSLGVLLAFLTGPEIRDHRRSFGH